MVEGTGGTVVIIGATDAAATTAVSVTLMVFRGA